MTRRRTIAIAASIATAATLVGCSTTPELTGEQARIYEDMKSNPTPSTITLTQRQADVANAMVFTKDVNYRIFMEDLGTLFLTDRPSRLTIKPTNY